MRRHIILAGSTISTSSLFDAISYVLRHPIKIHYETLESSFECEAPSEQAENMTPENIASLRRSLGFGGFEIKETDEKPSKDVIVSAGRAYLEGMAPKTWAESVDAFFRDETS